MRAGFVGRAPRTFTVVGLGSVNPKLVSVPLFGISLAGGVIYVGSVYAMALNNRQRPKQ